MNAQFKLPPPPMTVVQSTSVAAEVYTRDVAGAWPRDPVTVGSGGTIRLASIDFDWPMTEVYEGTHLAGDAGASAWPHNANCRR